MRGLSGIGILERVLSRHANVGSRKLDEQQDVQMTRACQDAFLV